MHDVGERQHALLGALLTGTTTVEISVVVPQKSEDKATSRSKYAPLEYMLKVLYILLQKNLLIYVYCHPVHNSQKLDTVWMSIR